MKKILSTLAAALLAMSASAYDLTVGTTEHGTLTFLVNDSKVTAADEGTVVTVKVDAGKGYIGKAVTARGYAGFGGMKAPRRSGSIPVINWQTVTQVSDSVYTFTMPAANVVVNAEYDHRALSNSMIEAIADQTWTGSAVKPTLVVKDRSYTLIEGTDYTVTYTGNKDKGVNTATATITPITEGNANHYLGTASATFSIRKSVSILIVYASPDPSPVYTGEAVEPHVTVRDGRTILTEGTDYTVTYSNNVNSGMAQFTVTGQNTYQGTLEGNFYINARDLSAEMISPVTGIMYSGSALYPTLTITYNGRTLVEGNDDNGATCDYYTTYTNNTETGVATVKVEGVNNFTGSFDYTFNINAKPLTSDMIGAISDKTYNGNANEPAPVVTYNGMTLNAGTDYTVSYANNVNAGTATLTITATAANPNYTGSATKNFTILKTNATVTDPTVISGLVYSGGAQALLNAGTVEGGHMEYSLDGTHYGTTVSTGTDAGSYTVYYKTVGDANHNDVAAKTLTVSIAKADITTMTLGESTFTYNKAEQTAQVTSVSAGTIGVGAGDYVVTGNKGTNVNTYTATVTAKSSSTNFKGSATAQWSIVEADAQVFTMVVNPGSFVYDGTAKQPSVTVKDGDDVLTQGTDYTLSFASNVDAGTAKVTATGMGNYTNTREATFTIQKANAQLGTAPAAQALTYNRSAQPLVSAGIVTKVGSQDESVVQYSLDGVNFSSDIPTKTDAGQYTVYYKVKGDANHNDTEVKSVSCAIQKDQATMSYATTSYSLTYGDDNFTNAVTKYGDNEIRYVSSDPRVAEVQYYTGEVSIKGIGQCTITAMMQEHTNFKKQDAAIQYSVTVAARAITADDVAVGEPGENGVPVITVSIETAAGAQTLQPESDYQLAYYDNTDDRNTVTVEQMLAAPGEYVAVLTFFGNYEGYVEKAITVASADAPVPGDIDGTGEVQVDDVEKFIDDMLSGNAPTEPGSDDFMRYDANQDGRIDIADAQAILNLAMGLNADGTNKSAGTRRQTAAAQAVHATMSVERTDIGDGLVRYALLVEGDFSFTGFQADVKGAGRIVTEGVAAGGMELRGKTMADGTHRMLGLPGTAEQQAGGTVAYVVVQGTDAVTFENVVLTTADARSISAASATTGISAASLPETAQPGDCYDLSGRKVSAASKGIVVAGGKKIVRK